MEKCRVCSLWKVIAGETVCGVCGHPKSDAEGYPNKTADQAPPRTLRSVPIPVPQLGSKEMNIALLGLCAGLVIALMVALAGSSNESSSPQPTISVEMSGHYEERCTSIIVKDPLDPNVHPSLQVGFHTEQQCRQIWVED